MLEVKNIYVSYDKNQYILEDISFTLNFGSLLTVIGPNGSGKSTLLKSVLGLQKVDSGLISFNGCSPRETIKNREIRLAYLPQHHTVNTLLPLTVYDVVSQGIKAYKWWWEILSVQDKELIDQVLLKVQMSDKKNSLFSLLSGGQRQRVLLALALVQKPHMLFLDEPTSALDIFSINTIYNILYELKHNGTAIMIISHDLGNLMELSDQVAVLSHQFKYLGSPKNIGEEMIHEVFGDHTKLSTKDPQCKFCRDDVLKH
ncbi:MAG: metal ABC transporter ATP-binding protein [Brevinemataceae bacterium]